MKILYLFPPQWIPISPHFALPSLMGQFEDTEFEVSAMDLNLDYYCEILTKDYVQKQLDETLKLSEELYKEIAKFYVRGKDFETYTEKEKNLFAKHVMIRELLANNDLKALKTIPYLIEGAVSVFRSKIHFYNPKLFLNALDIIDNALKIISAPYYPSKLSLSSYFNQNAKLNFESIKYYVLDEDTNPYIKFYQNKIPEILKQNANYIGISINSSSQITGGLTLAYMLKKQTNAHVTIGGNFFGRVSDSLLKRPEFFEMFCDSLIVEEGEKPVLELAKYIKGEIPIEEVSNLMYVQDGKVILNKITEPIKLNNLKPPSLNGLKLNKYFVPEIVFPFQTSRGCYWRKCSFCDHDFGMHYNVKDIDKLVEEIKYFKEKYGITKFEFIDESISPSYMKEMSERFIKENLNITFFCDARLESEFTKDILEIAYKAGLRMVLWGLESGSRKIMDLINKGVDFDKRLDVLRNAKDSRIFNFAFIFFGFPAETKEDAMKTINLICNNTDIIHVYGRSTFTMGRHTKLREAPEKYGVVGETYPEDEFSPTYVYKASGMTKEELDDIIKTCTNRCYQAYKNWLVFQFITRELLFLYIDKYGLEKVCNFKLDNQSQEKRSGYGFA